MTAQLWWVPAEQIYPALALVALAGLCFAGAMAICFRRWWP